MASLKPHDLDALRGKLAIALPALKAIANGKKAKLPHYHWVVSQLDKMDKTGHLPESILDYFVHENPDDPINKSIISVHADTAPATHINKETLEIIAQSGVTNVDVFGLANHDRDFVNRITEDGHFSDAATLVFAPGGPQSLYLLIRAIQYNLDNPKNQKFIIIQDTIDDEEEKETAREKAFWQPMLRALEFRKASKFRNQLGISISRNPKHTKRKLEKYAQDKSRIIPSALLHRRPDFSDGIELLYATSNGKKIHETDDIVRVTGRAASVRNPFHFLAYFFSAEEVSGTYSGNALEKLNQIIDRILDIGDREAKRRGADPAATDYKKLQWKLGVETAKKVARTRPSDFATEKNADPKKLAVIANDTGFSLQLYDADDNRIAINLAQQREFAEARPYTHPEKPFPGVELNHILDALGGPLRLFEQLRLFKERYEAETGQKISIRAEEVSSTIAMPLVDDFDDIQISAFYGAAQYDVTFDVPTNLNGALTFNHFFVTRGKNPRRLQSLIDTPEFYADNHDAQALKLLLDYYQVPKLSQAELAKRAALHNTERPMPRIMNELSYASSGMDWSDRAAIRNLFSSHEAFLFSEKTDKHGLKDDAFVDHVFIASSLGVGRQTRQPHIYGKALAYQNLRKKNGEIDRTHSAAPYWKLVEALQHRFLVKQMDYELVDVTGNAAQVAAFIHTQMLKKIPQEDYRFETETHGVEAASGDKPYRIAILGSASTKQKAHLAEIDMFINQITISNIPRAIEFKTGGGRYGVMGRAHQSIAAVRARNEELMAMQTSYVPQAIYSKEIQCPATIVLEGTNYSSLTKINLPKGDQFIVAEDIFERMDDIVDADCIIAGAGGIGTIQELVRVLQLKRIYPEKRHVPLIIFNTDGRYDAFKSGFTQKYLEANNIHFLDADCFGKGYPKQPLMQQAERVVERAVSLTQDAFAEWDQRHPRNAGKPSAAPAPIGHKP